MTDDSALRALQGRRTHPVLARLALTRVIDRHAPTWTVPLAHHPLSDVLSAISLPKIVSSYVRQYGQQDIKLVASADGDALGTIHAADLTKLRALASPSRFGKGTKLVYDESVRRGLEISASKLSFGSKKGMVPHEKEAFESIALEIQRDLFPGRPVKLVFYKLAMYEPNGHFKAHRDSTHGDSHHATLLIGCQADSDEKYKNGTLIIRAEGNEHSYSLDANTWVAFYTDLEHEVTTVESGVRMTLQFDVYLEDDSVERPHTVAYLRAEHPRPTHRGSTSSGYGDGSWELNALAQYQLASAVDSPTTAEPGNLEVFVAGLLRLLSAPRKPDETDQPRTVAFLLDHLYRRRSIRPRYLKGCDDALYSALTSSIPKLNVLLHPVTYKVRRIFSRDSRDKVFGNSDSEDEDDSDVQQKLKLCPPFKDGVVPTVEEPILLLHRKYAVVQAYDYSEVNYVGNEPMETTDAYFAGAMFVSLARDEKDAFTVEEDSTGRDEESEPKAKRRKRSTKHD